MENNIFNWNRFCKVVAKDFRNVWPTFGTTLIIITLLPIALWLIMLATDRDGTSTLDPSVRLMMIGALPSLASLLTPSRLYRTINLRGEGIYYAMLPASKLEKFLSILLYTLIVCPLMVLLGSYVLDMLLYLLPFGCYRESIFSTDWAAIAEDFQDPKLPHSAITMLLIAAVFGNIASSMLFLFTSTIFRRHKVLQTFLWLWLIHFVLSLVAMPLMLHFVENTSLFNSFVDYFSNHPNPKEVINRIAAITMVVSIAVAGLFGWLSWHRLKKMPY